MVTPIRSAGDIEVVDNTLIGRKDVIPSITIGEPLVPTTATTQRVHLKRTYIYVDRAVAPAQFEVEVYNGKTINIVDNELYMANVPDGGSRLIAIGTTAGAGDVADVYVERNKVNGTASGTPANVLMSLVYLPASQASGTAKIVARDNPNDSPFTFTNVEYAAARTNPRIIDKTQGQPLKGVYTAGDSTPSVAGGVEFLVIANASATNITDLDDGVDGQVVHLAFRDANTTLKYNGGLMRISPTGDDVVSALYKTVVLQRIVDRWVLISSYTAG